MTCFRVMFDDEEPVTVDAPFPSTAARDVAELLKLKEDSNCSVMDAADGSLTVWRVSRIESWYVRPVESS